MICDTRCKLNAFLRKGSFVNKLLLFFTTSAVVLGLNEGCKARDFNTQDNGSGADTAAFSNAKPNGDLNSLQITALKDTIVKSAKGGIGQSATVAPAEKCFVARGTVLKVKEVLKNPQKGHYFATFSAPIAAVQQATNSVTLAEAGVPASEIPLSPDRKVLVSPDSVLPATKILTPLTTQVNKAPESAALVPKVNIPAGTFANSATPCPFISGYVFEDDWEGAVLDPTDSTPPLVTKFFKNFKACAEGAGYLMGKDRCNELLDCSNSILRAYQKTGLPIISVQTDTDPNFESCKGGPYKPGDHLLLGKGCAVPDHWITLYKVNDKKNGNSPRNIIIDVSSDCDGLCSPAPTRTNIARRDICACARHRDIAKQWQEMK